MVKSQNCADALIIIGTIYWRLPIYSIIYNTEMDNLFAMKHYWCLPTNLLKNSPAFQCMNLGFNYWCLNLQPEYTCHHNCLVPGDKSQGEGDAPCLPSSSRYISGETKEESTQFMESHLRVVLIKCGGAEFVLCVLHGINGNTN